MMEIEEPIIQSKIPSIKVACYFSEINDIAEQMGYGSFDELKIPTQPSQMVRAKQPNCTVQIKDFGLSVVSKGGAHFNIPLEQPIQTIYPMIQGLLIQFTIKQQPKFSQILHLQRNKHLLNGSMYNEQTKFSYVTINKHPLNPLKVLNFLKNNQLSAWKYGSEEIIYVDNRIPFLISYDHVLQRNAFHILRINPQEIQRQNTKITFINNSYTLKAIGDSQYSEGQIVTQVIYQQNTSSQKFTKPLLCVGRNNNQLILNVNQGDTSISQIFLLRLIQSCQAIPLGRLQNVIYIQTFDLFDKQVHCHSLIDQQQEPINQLKNLNHVLIQKQIGKLKQFLMGIDNQNYFLMFNGQIIYKRPILSNNSKISYVTKKGNNLFQIVSNTGINQINNIRQIKDALTINILYILSTVIHQEMYVRILTSFLQLRQKYPAIKSQIEILGQYLVSLFSNMKQSNFKHSTLQKYKQSIFKTLHLLYEELKLCEYVRYRQTLLNLLFVISQNYKRSQRDLYSDYYLREGVNSQNITTEYQKNIVDNYQPIPDIFKFIREMISIDKDAESSRKEDTIIMPTAFKRTKFIVQLLQILIDGDTGKRSQIPWFVLNRNFDSVIMNKHRSVTTYPVFVQSIFQIKYYMKKMQGFIDARDMFYLTDVKEQKAYLYLIQNGLNLQQIKTYPSSIAVIIHQILRMMRDHLPGVLYSSIPEIGFNLIKRQDIYRNIKFYKRITIKPPDHLQNNSLKVAIQSLIHSSTSESYYLNSNPFEMNKQNNNIIFDQVTRLLSSTDDIVIKHKQLENIPEDKWELESQSIVAKFANRRLSVLVGQGAFTWGTSQTFITQTVKIPKISVSALMPNDMKVTLDLKEDKDSNLHHWAEFHNGVAAGLRLSKHIMPQSEDHLKTWIFYQKPQSTENNPKTQTPQRHHSGFLLAIGLMGYLKCFSPTDIYQYLKPNSELMSIALLLGVSASHIGRCEQYITQTLIIHVLPSTVDMDIPINVQTSALIGIGLIHKGTCNRTMTQMTLSQIGRSPSNDKSLDRQGYSLASGWALGLICLGSAGQKSHLDDLQLDKRLIRFIQGGKIMDPPQTMISNSFARDNKCSSIKQGPNVNLHITAPSALIAITLMYLKSNNKQISDQITIPETFNMIEQCNPNLILLKVIAKNLIMWQNIQNTSQFLYNQIPQLIKFIYDNSLQKVHESYYLVYNVSEIDYHTVSTVYVSSLTGAIVGMAMKYAGTSDAKALSIVKQHIQRLTTMKILKFELANDPINKNCIDQYTLFTLLATSILAMSIIVAGTCNQQCLRLAKGLKRKIQEAHNFHYGFNMAINMATGFICLGYGNYSFNRSDMGIASLLISIYPMFPNSPSDNKWHLQALRHFYVLAVQQKVFHTVDVDTNKVVNVKVQMTYQIQNQLKKQKLNTPILLQQSKKLMSVRIIDDNYFDIDFSFDEGTLKQPRVIYVKRRVAKSIQNQQFRNLAFSNNPEQITNINIFEKETHFKSLKTLDISPIKPTQLFSMLPNSESILKAINSRSQPYIKQISTKQLYYNFLKQDRLDILQIYLQLIKNQRVQNLSISQIQNIKVLQIFYKNNKIVKYISNQQSRYFSPTTFGALIKHYNNLFQCQFLKLVSSGDLIKYILQQPQTTTNNTNSNTKYKTIKYFNIPNVSQLQSVSLFFNKIIKQTQNLSNNQHLVKIIKNNIQMFLCITFPNCPLNILQKIIDFYLTPINQ